jgi:cytochrome c oxidase subunit 4
MSAQIVPARTYIVVWISLMVLLFLTWGVAQFDLGEFNVVAAMAIAVVKMLLVMLYFMHLRYSDRLLWLFAGAGFVWLLICFLLTMSDYTTRGEINPDLKGLPDMQTLPNQMPANPETGKGRENK